jgi:hypothetical protein
VSVHAKLADAFSEELCLRWRAEYPGYASARQEQDLRF